MRRLTLLLSAALLLTAAACATGEEIGAAQGGTMKITISIDDGKTLSATLSDSKSASAFAELLKKGAVTIAMHRYGGFEQVGALPQSLPRHDTQISTGPGDIVLYQGNQVVIFYGTNAWSYSRLGKIDGLTQSELREIFGADDVTAVFALAQ